METGPPLAVCLPFLESLLGKFNHNVLAQLSRRFPRFNVISWIVPRERGTSQKRNHIPSCFAIDTWLHISYIYAAGGLPFCNYCAAFAKGYRAQSVAHAFLSLDLVVCESLS